MHADIHPFQHFYVSKATDWTVEHVRAFSRLLGLLLHAISNSAQVQAGGSREEAGGILKPTNSSR